MKIIETKLKGCYRIEPGRFQDTRGSFTKLYHEDIFQEHGINTELREQFFTVSHKNVLRGMHFQIPPHDHDKLVTCLTGRVLDVVLDLRKDSDTYGEAAAFELSANNGCILFIPSGMAHGFLSLEDNSGMLYATSTVHSPTHDRGIRWDSFGFEWPCIDPIISERDRSHPTFAQFESPF